MPRTLTTESVTFQSVIDATELIQRLNPTTAFVLPTDLWEAFVNHPQSRIIKQPVVFLREAFQWLDQITRTAQSGDYLEIPATAFPRQWDGYKRSFWKQWLNDTEILTEDRRPGRPRYLPASISASGIGQCCRYLYTEPTTSESVTVIYIPRPRKAVKCELRDGVEPTPLMVRSIELTELHLNAAIRAEAESFTGLKLTQRIARCLSAVSEKRYIGRGQNSCRVHHTFSTLSKTARQHLHINSMPLHEIDVVNCQPLLLVALMRQSGLEPDPVFVQVVQSGQLYELLIGAEGQFLHWNGRFEKIEREWKRIEDRKSAKIEFFNSVLFDWKGHSPLNKRFVELFPMTAKACLTLHRGEETLACQLQCLESDIFNSIFVQSGYYWTLFDAVFFTDADEAQKIKGQIETAFAQFDLQVEVDVRIK